MPQPRRVKAADVAKEAGVSTATVSYVLNKTPGQKISETTAQRVREAAERLGYVGNTAAQTLARGHSKFVILDMSEFATQDSGAMAAAPVLTALRKLGFEAFWTWWPDGLDGFTRSERLLGFSRATNPHAVISVLPLPEELQASLRALGVQSLSSIVHEAEELAPALARATKVQVDFLAERGHEHVLYVASAQQELDPYAASREAAGARTAAARRIEWSVLSRYHDVPHLADSLSEAMAKYPAATAVAAYNDTDALATLFALHTLNVKIPDEMAVIGIDNEPLTELSYPKLTSIGFEFDLRPLGDDRLLSAMQGPGVQGLIRDYHQIVRPHVHVRESA